MRNVLARCHASWLRHTVPRTHTCSRSQASNTAHNHTASRTPLRPVPSRDIGQATTEYALVMLAAALVALLVVAWATSGGGAGKIGQLFDRVVDNVLQRVG